MATSALRDGTPKKDKPSNTLKRTRRPIILSVLKVTVTFFLYNVYGLICQCRKKNLLSETCLKHVLINKIIFKESLRIYKSLLSLNEYR